MIEGRNSSHEAPTVAKCDRILMKHQRVLHVSLASGLRQQKFEEKKKEEWVGVEEMIKGKRSTVNGAVPQQAPPPPPPQRGSSRKSNRGRRVSLTRGQKRRSGFFMALGNISGKKRRQRINDFNNGIQHLTRPMRRNNH